MKFKILLLALLSIVSCSNNEAIISVGELGEGQVVLSNINGKPIYIYASLEQDFYDLRKLDEHTNGISNINDVQLAPYYILEAHALGGGCMLKFYPKSSGSDNWFGGFVDPCKDTNYDLSGRSIITGEYTKTNFPAVKPALYAYRYTIKNNGNLLIWPK